MTVTAFTDTRTRPGAGWLVTGADRGVGTPPSPPPHEVTVGLLDADQRGALDRYSTALDALAAAREAMAARRRQLDRAVEDDRDAADEALAAGADTAPPSVAGARGVELDRALRYAEAALRACVPALGEVWQVLGPPERRRVLLEKAWAALDGERKRDPASIRRRVASVTWALAVGDRLTPGRAVALDALDAVPVSQWEQGLAEVLDALGAQVADAIAELTELLDEHA
jgi:hypothetical protein